MDKWLERLLGNEDILKFLERIVRNRARILQYRPEFFLIDLSRVFRELQINNYRVITKLKQQEYIEENNTYKTVEVIKSLKPSQVNINLEIGDKKWEVKIKVDPIKSENIYTFTNGYELMRRIALSNNKKDDFDKFISETSQPVLSEFVGLSRLIRETTEKQARSKKELMELRIDAIERVFLLVSIITTKIDDLYLENQLNNVPDKCPYETIRNVDDMLEYINWFILHKFKSCLEDEKKLFLSVIAGRTMVINGLMVVLMRQFPNTFADLLEPKGNKYLN